MRKYVAPAGKLVHMKVRVDERPYLAGFQTPPKNSKWENIAADADGMGEGRDFRMPPTREGEGRDPRTPPNPEESVSFNGRFYEEIGPSDPAPAATYKIVFTVDGPQIGEDQVVVPKGMGPVAREYTFVAT